MLGFAEDEGRAAREEHLFLLADAAGALNGGMTAGLLRGCRVSQMARRGGPHGRAGTTPQAHSPQSLRVGPATAERGERGASSISTSRGRVEEVGHYNLGSYCASAPHERQVRRSKGATQRPSSSASIPTIFGGRYAIPSPRLPSFCSLTLSRFAYPFPTNLFRSRDSK